MIISTAVSVMTVVITENKLKVAPKLLTWYQPMAVEKKKEWRIDFTDDVWTYLRHIQEKSREPC